jgi:O-antigen ligase
MLMGLPVVLGYFCGLILRGGRSAPADWHHRVLWLGSAEASRILFVGSILLCMGLALVLTLSRSGLLGFAVAMTLATLMMVRKERGSGRQRVALTYLVLLATVSIGWVGVETISAGFSEFAEPKALELSGRVPVWRDTLAVARDFWSAGAGLNTFSTTMLHYQSHSPTLRFSAAHNDYLQLLAEGGVLLCIPILISVFLFVREVRRRFQEQRDDEITSWIRIGAVTGLVAIGVQEFVDFSLQMPGNAVLFCTLAALAIHRRQRAPAPTRPA